MSLEARDGTEFFPEESGAAKSSGEEELEIAFVGFCCGVVGEQCLHEFGVVELLNGAIAEGDYAGILTVANAFAPFGSASAGTG